MVHGHISWGLSVWVVWWFSNLSARFIAAVRRPSPISPCTARSLGGVTVNDSLREIVNRVSKVFGLRFFGVDCLEVDGRLEVLEVNDFPNYSSVPNASEVLARRVLMRAVA